MDGLFEVLRTRVDAGEASVDLLLGLAVAMADALGRDRSFVEPLRRVGASEPRQPVPCPADPRPELLGQAHELLLAAEARHDRGVHYTPEAVAAGVVARVMPEPSSRTPPVVCDPSVGGGAFLLAAGRVLVAQGHAPEIVVETSLRGADIDPTAVAVCRVTLALWAGTAAPVDSVVVADSLRDSVWVPGSIDVVVGNPPFLSQLGSRTSRDRAEAAAIAERFADLTATAVVSAYTDTAALFLLLGLEMVGMAGRVALVEPLSLLATRDAGGVRDACLARAQLEHLWYGPVGTFDAAVAVCAPVLAVGAGDAVRPAVALWQGADFESAGASKSPALGEPWAGLVATILGVPDPSFVSAGVVGDSATATAGFRDEYYAVTAVVRESTSAVGELPVVPVGSVDPLRNYWGVRPARVGGTAYVQPVVSLAGLAASPKAAAWAERLQAPKLLLATQSSTLEVWVDTDGHAVPLTPVVAVVAAADELWHLAAVLTAPAITAWAARRTVGAARSVSAVKLAARQVLEVPLPANLVAWDEGARWAERAQTASDADGWFDAIEHLAEAMNIAYGVGPEVGEWWRARRSGADGRVRKFAADAAE